MIQQTRRFCAGPLRGCVAASILARTIFAAALFAFTGTALSSDAPRTQAEFELYKKTQDKASNAAYQAGEMDKCRAIETETLEMSRRFGDRREEASSIYGLGLVDTATGRPDEAEARFRESIVLWKAINDQKGVASSLRGLGRVLEARGRLPEATEVQVAALELFLKFGKPIDQSESYYSLARLFMNLEDYPAARRAVDRAIVLMGPSPPDFPLGLNLAVQADVLRELGQPQAARDSAQRGLDAFIRTKSPMGEAIGQLALGKALAVTGEADRGLAMLRTAEGTAQKMQEEVLATDLRVAQGLVLVQEKRFEEALVPLGKALETAERLKLDQVLRNISVEQEKAYSALRRPSDALAASKRAYAAQSRLAGLAKVGELAGRSAESQLSAISSRFMSLDEATRASAPVLAPKPAPARAAPVSPWLWAVAAVAVLGLFALGLRIFRLREEGRRMGRAHAELKDHSAQLAHQVSIDPLTGVLTRRAFTDELAILLQVAQAGATP
ncbi:MAG: tetratricopeptide repeat protein, partial [Gammaproteobacteria bacterium]|nr:tetratricopeptide repeat protein [Gammaproteobacteria bacterium]